MKVQKIALCFMMTVLWGFTFAQNETPSMEPSFESVLSLKSARGPILSPDGKHLIFSKRSTDWKNNRYDNELWLSKNGGPPFQLTRTQKGSSFGAEWSPDNQWIAFLSDRGNKNQIYVLRVEGGEAFPVTNEKEGVQQFQWSPNGTHLTFTKLAPKDKGEEKRENRFGKYQVDDAEYRRSWLYQIPFNPEQLLPSDFPCYEEQDSTQQDWKCIKWPEAEALVDSLPLTVSGFSWAPDGKTIAISHTPDPLINSFLDADISLLVAIGYDQTTTTNIFDSNNV